jgi:putative membrane protein
MLRILVVWLINAAALAAVAYLMPSVSIDTPGAALAAALVLGLVNARAALLVSTRRCDQHVGLFITRHRAALLGGRPSPFPVAGFWSGVFGDHFSLIWAASAWASR